MKKNIILLICVFLFIGLISFVQIALGNDVDWITTKTHTIQTTFDHPEQAMHYYNELYEHWHNNIVFWGMLLPHDNLLEVSKDIEKLGTALHNQNKEDADQAAATIDSTMRYLLHRNTLRWDHIF